MHKKCSPLDQNRFLKGRKIYPVNKDRLSSTKENLPVDKKYGIVSFLTLLRKIK